MNEFVWVREPGQARRIGWRPTQVRVSKRMRTWRDGRV